MCNSELFAVYLTQKKSNQAAARRTRDALAAANDKLALLIANRMLGSCDEELEDLAQLARIGLLKAIERFDPSKGYAFSSFAVPYIQGEILHFLRAHWGLIQIPRQNRELIGKVRRVVRRCASLGREISEEDAAAACGLTAEAWRQLLEDSARPPIVDLAAIAHMVPDESESEPGDEDGDRRRLLLQQLARLPRIQRECLLGRYYEGLEVGAIARQRRCNAAEVEAAIRAGLERMATLQEAI